MSRDPPARDGTSRRTSPGGPMRAHADPQGGPTSRFRDGAGVAFLVAIGLLTGGYAIYHFAEPGEPVLGQLLSVAALVGLALPLLGSAYWLSERHANRAWRATRWSISAAAAISILALMTIYYQGAHGVSLAEPVVLLVWIAGTGALGGVLIGLYDVRQLVARERHSRTAARLSTVFEATPVALLELDTEAVVTRWNPAAARILGWEAEEVIGRELPFADGTDRDWSAIATGEVALDDAEVQLHTRDGSRLVGQLWSTPLQEGGEVTGALVVIVDFTRRVELEQERSRQQDQLVRTETLADVGGWEYVPATDTLRWTDGVRRILELPAGYDPTVEDALDRYHPEDRPIIEEAFEKCLESGVSFSVTLRVITDTGRQRWVHSKGERSIEDGVAKITGAIQDVSDRMMNEQRLMVLNRVLRHNLRNKLTTVMGYADLLEDELSSEEEDYVQVIETSAESLLSIAEKSQRFNAVLEHDYTTGPVELTPLLEELVTDYSQQFPDAEIRENLADVLVPGNETALRILFGELLENALKHNHADGPVVEVTVSRSTDLRAAISIVDNGPGLPEQERQVLEQGEETALLHSDGLGLWIVNWLVTKLSGGIDVTANGDGGTNITVTLPRIGG